jgi:glycolate oxidase FAD binding subunit
MSASAAAPPRASARPAPAVPASPEALADLVRAAADAGGAVFTEGRGTKRHHGPAAAEAAQAISLERLDAVTFYEPGDLVIGVQAGLRLEALARVLAAEGQWLPVDPPYADATLGGVLATNGSGPRRLGYGPIKDYVIGMSVLGPGGALTRSGGRVVKNVTGYDLHKLHVGAFGSLGVIVEVNLKVTPRPAVSAALALAVTGLPAAHRLLLEVAGGPLRPVALEALDAGAATGLRRRVPALPPGDALAIIGVEGSQPVVERHVRELGPARARATAAVWLEGAEAESLWRGFRDAAEDHRAELTLRIGARPHELPALLSSLGPGPAGATGVAVAAGTGLARVYLPAPQDAAALGPAIAAWHDRAAARGGYVVVEAAPLALPGRAALPWAAGAGPLGPALKAGWDPHDVLNPGRMAL